MPDLPNCFTALLAAWNETDPANVRGHLNKALAPDILFADPHYFIHGIDAFEAMVHEFHEKYPSPTTEHTSGYNMHNNRYRYNWLVSFGGKPAMPGMDVTEVNADGLICRIDGFFGSRG
ncbi:MAG: hypothetical protein ACPGVT_10360 [Maricaulaceae bacterium]